jgi:site-specific DNA recombinase
VVITGVGVVAPCGIGRDAFWAGLQAALDALDAQQIDREAYLKLAENLESFLARLRQTAETATVEDRQKVLRNVVKEVLVGPERVVIRHSIPVRDHPFLSSGYPLRWGRRLAVVGEPLPPLRVR